MECIDDSLLRLDALARLMQICAEHKDRGTYDDMDRHVNAPETVDREIFSILGEALEGELSFIRDQLRGEQREVDLQRSQLAGRES